MHYYGLWLFACFDGRKVLPYIVAQLAGAFCAAALVYGLYYNLFFDFEAAHQMVRGSNESLALPDDGNGIPRSPLAPLLIGILIAVIGASMGLLSGFALNPQRVTSAPSSVPVWAPLAIAR